MTAAYIPVNKIAAAVIVTSKIRTSLPRLFMTFAKQVRTDAICTVAH